MEQKITSPDPDVRTNGDPVDDDQDISKVYQRALDANVAGLALSGGGIRSATFNLGVIQALSNKKLLSRFDYLSTVSGGGYIGAWLSAFLHRETVRQRVKDKEPDLSNKSLPKAAADRAKFEKVLKDELNRIKELRKPESQAGIAEEDGKSYVVVRQKDVDDLQTVLKTHPSDAGYENDDKNTDKTSGFTPVEHIAVRYLRRFSNFLAPRLGLTGDVLALVSIVLRNITVIQLALISLVASCLLAAIVLAIWSGPVGDMAAWWPSLLLLAVAVAATGWFMSRSAEHRKDWVGANIRVNLAVVVPVLLATWWFSAVAATRELTDPGASSLLDRLLPWVTSVAAVYVIAWIIGFGVHFAGGREERIERGNKATRFLNQTLSSLFAGVLLGVLLFLLVDQFDAARQAKAIDLWNAVAFGPPVLLLLISFVVTLHIGAVRRGFSHHDREFLARLGGIILLYAAGWTVLFLLVLYATPFVRWLAAGGAAALATWVGGSALGTWFARGSQTGATTADGSRWKETVTRIAPWFFVTGLAIIVTWVTQTLLYTLIGDPESSWPVSANLAVHATANLQQLQALPLSKTVAAFGIVFAVFWIVVWRLDINLFSLHTIYWNRLTRAYLGASCAPNRSPNPFTGFDNDDDLEFCRLAWQRPLHIINTAINMTGGDDLAWQTRRAASFTFTPVWSGFEARSSLGDELGTYRPTSEYAGGRRLGTWVAVSGAAASPNMGYHTSAAVSGLLTAFNLRLGRWCGNPAKNNDVWKECSPRIAATPIVKELTGSANAQANWVNLTDGGHFENLGVYELVRRRCRLIVVTDVGCDPEHHFDDLANMIRKCWVDFGVDVRIHNLEPLTLKKKTGLTKAHFVFGRIRYGKQSGKNEEGAIIYIKSSLTGSEWPDIKQYADENDTFPHETTADQFFNENQFEAYRHLGYKAATFLALELERTFGKAFPAKPINAFAEEPIKDMAQRIIDEVKAAEDARK